MKQFLALKASAGSGKTYALTLRYISLLFKDIEPNSILTLTFTNKAASEMSERIFKTLLTLGKDINILDEISSQTQLSHKQILDKKDLIIKSFLSSELFIITLDKFINKILREFAGYINISDDFSIENDDYDLMVYKFLLSLDHEKFTSLIEFSHTSSKKLNGIIELFSSLEDKNYNYTPIEFSNELVIELEKEILQNGYKIKEFVLNSDLSASAMKAVSFENFEQLLDLGKTWLTKDSLGEFSYFKKAKTIIGLDNNLHQIKHYLSLYYRYKEVGVLNSLFDIYTHFKEFRYKYKKEKNSLEFNDITNLVFQLLERFDDKDFLYFRLDAKFDHILIDEFQDTSIMQYKILKPLIDEVLSGSEKYKTFFYVGDTKQSIYRFRGGRKELFDYVHKTSNDQIVLDSLNTNYRSAKNIVEFVNSLYSNLSNYDYLNQIPKSLQNGYVEVVTITDENNDFGFLKEKIDELIAANIDPNKIAILTYTNSDVLAIYEYLKNQYTNLKIVTDMTSKLINQKNVKAVIQLVKYFYFNEEIYKANFNAILGYESGREIGFDLNIDSFNLVELVKTIGSRYQLLEENLLKFIEGLSKYDDIVDFVFEVDKDDTPMVNSENIGLQILTIFKSKGLEFDTVLLLDRMKNKNSDKSTLLFSYDDIELRKVFYKEKGREYFDLDYHDAIEKEKHLSRDDELNVLYVALTRAEYNMIIFKKEKNSAFDILDMKIENYKVGALIINEHKDKVNHTQIANYTPMSLGDQEIDETKIDEKNDDLKSRYFGLATHYALEMMKEFTILALEYALQFTKNKYGNILDSEDFHDIEKRIGSLIRNNSFRSLLEDGKYSKEQSLVYNEEIKIIDLLIQKKDHFVIVDYKTTQNEEETHIYQVKNYMKYIKNITNRMTLGYIVYLKEDDIYIKQVV